MVKEDSKGCIKETHKGECKMLVNRRVKISHRGLHNLTCGREVT